MLYIDGMEGVIRHKDTIRWLYTLISSRVSYISSILKFLFFTFYIAFDVFKS